MWKLIRQDIREHWKAILSVAIALVILVKGFGAACISQLIVGMPCPACGMSRAAVLFLKGHWLESLRMQPLFMAMVAGVLLLVLCRYVLKKHEAFLKYYAIFLIVFAIVFYLYRMIRYFPDVEPMTYRSENLFYSIRQLLHTILERI